MDEIEKFGSGRVVPLGTDECPIFVDSNSFPESFLTAGSGIFFFALGFRTGPTGGVKSFGPPIGDGVKKAFELPLPFVTGVLLVEGVVRLDMRLNPEDSLLIDFEEFVVEGLLIVKSSNPDGDIYDMFDAGVVKLFFIGVIIPDEGVPVN